MSNTPVGIKALGWLAVLVVVGTVVLAFSVVGTPAEQRALRADEERINSLLEIRNAVRSFYRERTRLPKDLDELLNASHRLTERRITDPETSIRYFYEPGEGSRYRLGATFEADYDENQSTDYYSMELRGYKKGRFLFDLDAKSKDY